MLAAVTSLKIIASAVLWERQALLRTVRCRQVAMDMARPYIQSVRKHTEAETVFDKFHVFQHLGEAVDRVRRQENQELARAGDDRLKNTKYLDGVLADLRTRKVTAAGSICRRAAGP